MTLKDMTIKALDYLINVKGISKRQIAKVIGVPSSRLTYVYGAKWVDPKLLEAIYYHWPETKLTSQEGMAKMMEMVRTEAKERLQDQELAKEMAKEMEELKIMLMELEKKYELYIKNK